MVIQRPVRLSTTNISTSPPSPSRDHDETCSFSPDAADVAAVRRFVAGWLLRAGLEQWTAVQLTSELAGNVARHAGTEYTVRIGRRGDRIRVEVGDCDTVVPAVAEIPGDAEYGRGLRIVQDLSTAWGVEFLEGGKSVFFEVPAERFVMSAPQAGRS